MHIQRKLRRSIGLSALVATSLPMPALAAGTATIEGESTKGSGAMTIMWQDDGAMRVNPDPSSPENYLIVRDGKVYNISRNNGKPMVMEVGGMLKAFGEIAKGEQKGEQGIPAKIESVKATGKSETIAGIKGHVYNVTAVNTDGTRKTAEAVLSSDTRATEMTQVYLTTILSIFGQTDPNAVLAALPKNERGLLRYGQDYRLASISGDAPAADQFKLPATPINFADLLKNFQPPK